MQTDLDSHSTIERLPKRSTLLIERTNIEYANSDPSSFYDILSLISNFYSSEVTKAVDFLIQKEDLDSIYRMLIFIREALINYCRDPFAQILFEEPFRSNFLYRISDLVLHHPFEGLIGILARDIHDIVENVLHGDIENIELPEEASSEYRTAIKIKFAANPFQIKYTKARMEMMLLRGHINNLLNEDLYAHGEKRSIFSQTSGYEFCDNPQNLKFRVVASDALVATYRNDFSNLPRFLATESNTTCDLYSYPHLVGDLEMQLRGKRSDLHRHLKIMHHEVIVQAVRSEFGIDIFRISLKSQIFFLEFLHQATSEKLEIFKEALALMDVEKRHRFVETFLVCVDETLSDSLLSIAQNPEGNALFLPAYSYFIKSLESISFEVADSQKPLFFRFQRKFTILVGNHFLQMLTEAKSPEEQRDLCDRFREEVKNISEIFSTLIKTIKRECEGDDSVCEDFFNRGANRQLTSMVEKWRFPVLPDDFIEQINMLPEQEEVSENDYFAVGISRKLDTFDAVFAGQKQALKPASILTYLFWINAQRKDLALVVCDRIQIHNARMLFDHPSETLEKAVQAIGDHDAAVYRACVDHFGLTHVQIARYDHLTENERFEHYRKFCERMVTDNPLFQKAFDCLIHDEIAGITGDTKGIRDYGIEEIAWILAHPHKKITHIREASYGYDPLACVIRNVESLAKKQCINNIWNFQNEQMCRSLLYRVLLGLQSRLSNEIKESKADARLYREKFRDFLFGNKHKNQEGAFDMQSLRPESPQRIKSVSVDIPFIIPEGISSQSFGNSERNLAGAVSFSEPYNTMFVNSKNPVFDLEGIPLQDMEGLESVVLSRMDSKKQTAYMQKVLIPLVRMYRANLEHFSPEYFSCFGFVGKKEGITSIRKIIQNLKTYLDLLEFIRRYVLLPQ